jgi:KaiC/GvpD/RAD55 family RecA-like ATPase
VDLEEAGEVIRRLSPKGLCRGALLNSLRDFLTEVAGGVAGDVFRAILALILLGAGLGGFVPVILGALASSTVGGAFKQVLRWLAGKVDESDNEVFMCFREFINTAREASRYIDYEEVQDLVNDVAREWGMGSNEFKNLVRGFASLTEGSDVRRLFENGLRKVEELEVKVNELNNWVNLLKQELTASITIANKTDFEQGTIYPNIKVKNSELRIRAEDEYHNIVRAGKFNELINKVRGRLTSNGFVVVIGPKGIGKSTLAAAVIWELFMNGDIGLVARVDVLDSKNYSEFATFVENYGERFSEYFGRLLILYDPVSTKAYEKVGVDVKAPVQSSIERTVKNLMDFVDSISPEATKPLTLIVIPSDIYNALSEEMRNALKGYRLDVSLSDAEFLAGLIREYTKTRDKPSGCSLSNDVLSKLADEVAGFDSGHALIARLTGEELARNNCDVGKIEELISNAKGKAETFIILHINGLFKVSETSDTTKEAIVKVFALRRPFINRVRPGDPILTPGIVELMGVSGLSGWLAIRQHDLIEGAIKKLLDCIVSENEECKGLGDALKPWKTIGVMESLREVSEKVRDVGSAVNYFAKYYGKRLTGALRSFSNCWRRAALIIGYALAGRGLVPRFEDLPEDVRESIKGALDKCDVDYYLLVGNVIPPLIMNLVLNYVHVSTEAFIDRYNEAVVEVSRVLNIARDRGSIYNAESSYGLGLVSIIANAADAIELNNANVVLHFASFAIQYVVLPIFIKPILSALRPLRDKAPLGYLELLAPASVMESLDLVTVRHIFKELNEILDNYGDVVKGYAWSLVHAITTYANLLSRYPAYFDRGEVGDVVRRVIGLLNELGRFGPSLGFIAWAFALAPALAHEYVRRLMERGLSIDVVSKANEILGKLNKMREKEKVKDLMSDEEFMSYIESMYIKTDEEIVKKEILGAASHLKSALARYRLDNDELDEAEKLFNEVAKELREIDVYGDYLEDYLIDRGWALRVEAIKGSLVGDELVKKFQQLYEETFSKGHFKPTAQYLSVASGILGNYLVFLALTGGDEEVKRIKELLEEHWWVLNANKQVSVLTRLMLNALLGHRVELSGKLKGKLSVNSEELIETLNYYGVGPQFLPALRVTLGIVKPEDRVTMCVPINDSIKGERMVCGDSAVEWLRWGLVNDFRELLIKRFGRLKELGVNADKLFDEFMELVVKLDGKSLVQLNAPRGSMARLALMLYALINGDERLAKAHALYGAVDVGGKLPTRLLLETYETCCDPNNEEFRHAIAKLFLYHF